MHKVRVLALQIYDFLTHTHLHKWSLIRVLFAGRFAVMNGGCEEENAHTFFDIVTNGKPVFFLIILGT